jgi:hypothetical protein
MQVIIRHEIFLMSPQFTQKLPEKWHLPLLMGRAFPGNRTLVKAGVIKICNFVTELLA